MFNAMVALILAIAAESGVPPNFALAIALKENPTLNPASINRVNDNGTLDLGVMQLNSSWFKGNWRDPETNIRAGCRHIKALMGKPEINTFWAVAAAYNCGYRRFLSGPPAASIEYANSVMESWLALEGVRYINPVIERAQ